MLKLKAQPTNAFFVIDNKMFGGSASQLPTTAEHYSFVWIVFNVLITTRSTVVGSWEQPPNMISLTVEKNAFDSWPLNFRVRVFLKGAISSVLSDDN